MTTGRVNNALFCSPQQLSYLCLRLRAFWNDKTPFKGSQPSCTLGEAGGPRTVPRTTDLFLDYVFVKITLVSLIQKLASLATPGYPSPLNVCTYFQWTTSETQTKRDDTYSGRHSRWQASQLIEQQTLSLKVNNFLTFPLQNLYYNCTSALK